MFVIVQIGNAYEVIIYLTNRAIAFLVHVVSNHKT